MDVYVIGYACHPPAEKVLTKRLEEMVYDTSAQALRAAVIERSELDHITIAACDELDGRSISNMLMVAPAGGYLKDELRVTDSAMVGLHLAAMRIASGRYDLGLLASWNKSFDGALRRRDAHALRAVLYPADRPQRDDPGCAVRASAVRCRSRKREQGDGAERNFAACRRIQSARSATKGGYCRRYRCVALSRDAPARRALRAGHRRSRIGGVGFRRMA